MLKRFVFRTALVIAFTLVSAGASLAQTTTVSVNSALVLNPTGVQVTAGQRVIISATGLANLSAYNGGYTTDPNGTIRVPPTPGSDAESFFTADANPITAPPIAGSYKLIINGYPGQMVNEPFGALIAGFSPNPAATSRADFPGTLYDVHSSATLTAPISGYLYLAVNDINNTSDDVGSYSATITVEGPPVASVEFTQSIQQYQTLNELKASLIANNEPPVPIVANKPAVMRVYLLTPQDTETFTVTATGAVSGTQTVDVWSGCTPADERGGIALCNSADLYFIPPVGTWTTTVTVADSSGAVVETDNFTISSRTTQSLNLKAVSLCSSPTYNTFSCGDPASLLGMTYLVGTMMPAPNPVTVQVTTNRISKSVSSYIPKLEDWESYLVQQVKKLYLPADAAADAAGSMRTDYVGVYSPIADPDGQATSYYGGHAIVVPSSNNRLGDPNGVWATLSHETGHTLGQEHTGIGTPYVGTSGTAPGCWDTAMLTASLPASAAWPYATNFVQSSARLEYGFNVVTETLVDPFKTFDIMSYCVPRWISPFNYKIAIAGLGGGAVTSPSVGSSPGAPLAAPAAPTLVQGSYWQVSGTILGSAATLDPIFTQTIQGTTDPGTGTYSIQAQNASGQAVYTRYFTPLISGTEAFGNPDVSSDPEFSEWIPVTAGTKSIVVLDQNSNVLTSQPLSGTAPIVTITSPAAGFIGSGVQTISWTAQSSALTLTTRLFYSTDGGNTWQQVDELIGTSDTLDFTKLPGAAMAMLRVDVSDGVNTGSATSIPFSVPRKLPSTIVINAPLNGAVQPAANPVDLSGAAYDADDGVLTGSALQWTDNIQGALGSGSFLPVNLQPGAHTLTLTATDSDGNAITATTNITLGGGRPIVTLTTSSFSANCVSATISAAPGNQGAALSTVQYTVDGSTFTNVPITALPYTFLVPGSSSETLVATAADLSQQKATQSVDISLSGACTTNTVGTPAAVNLSGPTSATVGTSVPLTSTVSGSGGTPTGTVIFQDGSTTLANVALVNGSAGYSTSGLAIGQHSITATYSGDGVFASAVSTAQPVTINGYTSAIALTASPATTHPGQTVMLGATVTAATGAGTPTGSVTFLDGANSIGNANLALDIATLTTTTLSLGTHSITASYSGDSNFAGSTSTAQTISVVSLPTPAIAATPSQTTITTAQAFSVGVIVSGTGSNPTPTGTVTLSGGGYTSSAVTLSGGSATINVPANSLTVGTDSLTINYSGDTNYATGTGAASIVVSAVPLTPTVTVAPSANTLDTGSSLSVKATVTGAGVQPTGSVTLSGGGYTSSAATLVAGIYTFTIPANSLSSGADTLAVSYSGDSVYASGNGTAPVTVTQSVFMVSATTPTAVAPGSPATSTVSISSSTNYSGTVSFTCALTSSPSGAIDMPTCSVTNPTVAVSNGVASGSSTVTVNSTSTSGELAWPITGGKGRGLAGGAVLAFLVFLGIPARRRSWRSMLGAVVLIAVLVNLAGCGGTTKAPSGTTAGSYTFTVTGTGSPSVSPAPAAAFNLIVN